MQPSIPRNRPGGHPCFVVRVHKVERVVNMDLAQKVGCFLPSFPTHGIVPCDAPCSRRVWLTCWANVDPPRSVHHRKARRAGQAGRSRTGQKAFASRTGCQSGQGPVRPDQHLVLEPSRRIWRGRLADGRTLEDRSALARSKGANWPCFGVNCFT